MDIITHPTLLTNLVAYYKLDGNANDAHTNALNGTAEGTPTYPSGLLRSCVDLNGTSQCISLGTSALLNPASITCAAWVKLDTTTGSRVIACHRSEDTPLNEGWWLMIANGKWHCGCYTTGGDWLEEGTVDTNWHHVAIVYDSATALLQLWVDRVVYFKTHAYGGAIATGASVPMLLGAQTQAPLPTGRLRFLDGKVDEVAVHSRALSYAELLDLNHSGYPLRYNEVLASDLVLNGADALSSLAADGVLLAGKDYYRIDHPTDHARDVTELFQIGRKCADEAPWLANAGLQQAMLKTDPDVNTLIRSTHPQHEKHVGMGAGVYIKRRS